MYLKQQKLVTRAARPSLNDKSVAVMGFLKGSHTESLQARTIYQIHDW